MTLLAYWKCDENLGRGVTSVADTSGHANNHDFTSVGYASTSTGFVNKTRHCTGASGEHHSSVNNNADFLLLGDMTIMAWVRPLRYESGVAFIVSMGAIGETLATNFPWALSLGAAQEFSLSWEYGSGTNVFASSPTGLMLPTGGPYHIAVVRTINGALRDVKFYLDGVDLSADVTGLTAPDGATSTVVEMLRFPTSTGEIPGANISNVRVYDTAESPASVLAVYTSELAEAVRVASPAYAPGSLIQYEPDANNAYSIAPKSGATIGQMGADAYGIVNTGTNLDQEERPMSGWAQASP